MASSVNEKATLGEILTSQIEYRVEEHCKAGNQITTEEFVEMLFSPNPKGEINADIIIGRIQIG
ncbi:MAG: hypothetical protein ABIJ05_00370 [Patescibacteria group bacterium]